MALHHIYWYNLENLFDIEHSPDRTEFLEDVLKKELKGWTQAVLDQKIQNLVSVISQFSGNGPDILGVCEIENDNVLNFLVSSLNNATGRVYEFVHQDGIDKRGIDTALIFDSNKYNIDGEVYDLRIIKRNATRDLLQVQLMTENNNLLVLVLNHWPSRSGGVFESEPYRIMVAENLAYWIERIHEERGEHCPIVLMGDFNDNPYDRSLVQYLQSSNNKKRVENARNHFMYNLMHEFLDKQIGTHVYGNEVNILDQFLVSKTIISDSANYPFTVESVNIIAEPNMVAGEYKTPIRYGRPFKSNGSVNNSFDGTGFSDHLPIELVLKEKD